MEIISEFNWDLLCSLESKFENFEGIISDLIASPSKWEKYSVTPDLFNNEIPEPFSEKLNVFDKLLLVKIFQPKEILSSIRKFIKLKMGDFYLGVLDNSLESIYEESDNITPIIFVLSKGADPSNLIKKLGEAKGFKIYDKLHPISLGQGQGIRAEKLINFGKIEGNWILLENCHLAKTWMPRMEQIIDKIQSQPPEEVHKDFRLFLTSMPATYFPV